MKLAQSVLYLSFVALTSWGCTAESVNPLGGQAGDDGDFAPSPPDDPGSDPVPPVGVPVLPGLPPIDGCEPTERVLEADEISVLGATTQELLANLAQPSAPLHWVPFAGLPGSEYQPGPSEASLTITFEVGKGDIREVERSHRASDPDKTCEPSQLSVPVTVHFETSDGALAEVLETTLNFRGPTLAVLNSKVPTNDIQGGFEFTTVGLHNPGEVWKLDYLYIDALVWPGGSQGRVHPKLSLTNPPEVSAPPVAPVARTPVLPSDAVSQPQTPDHWFDIAAWPTPERCSGEGTPLAADARVLGFSASDVLDELGANGPWLLETHGEPGQSRQDEVRFNFEPLPGRLCARIDGLTQRLAFEASARLQAPSKAGGAPEAVAGAGLSADAATGPGEAIAGLDATALYEVWAMPHPTEPRIEQLHFHRRLADVVRDTTSESIEAATGLQLELSDEYQRFWWSWHATIDVDTGTASAELIVTSMNAEQSAAAVPNAAQGGPAGTGVRISLNNEGWVELPGDVVFRATTAGNASAK